MAIFHADVDIVELFNSAHQNFACVAGSIDGNIDCRVLDVSRFMFGGKHSRNGCRNARGTVIASNAWQSI